ncbi:FAD-dependent oxidoreductase [Amycolatopsis jejuensis]|uniref:FAD-dependent oxidoreductase n=1 Tax=Amycolatopsis jejuensis TaxID=330084 RepID=UPI00052587FE|nr:NAD(P)/FAD-dependent oxidoreductase [Amycolatopsis jejuensis]
MSAHLRVLVIGAGIGGLALAQGLHRAGIDVTVCERDPAPTGRLQGYRLRLNQDGLDALDRLLPPGLARLIWDTSSSPSRSGYRHGTPSGAERNVAVNRLTLRQILLHGLGDVVEFGRDCTGYQACPDGTVTATFADGSQRTADVLVAADGVNSVVRRHYLPHAQVMDTGVRIMYGRFPLTRETAELVPDEWFQLYAPLFGPDHQHIGIAPVHARCANPDLPTGLTLTDTADYVMCLFAARTELLPPDDELRTGTGRWLRDLTADLARAWQPAAADLLARAETGTFFPIFMRSSVPLEPWPTTSVTLLGDAIHAMSPAVGVGANTALRDADLLTVKLTEAESGADLITAIREYETTMIDYGFDAVRTSAKYGAIRMGQTPLPG